MDLGIRDKVAMVAAASQGIGLATAKSLVQEGVKVSICGRDAAKLEAATSQLGPAAVGFVCDVSKSDDLDAWHRQTVDRFGPPDIVVTNTGGPPAGKWTTMTDEQWIAGFDSTLLNIVRLVRLVEPGMRAAGWGRIVHITSVVAKEPSPMLPISTTLRAGICGLTRLQATELAPFGVTVNSVLPGHTLTDRQLHLQGLVAEREGISIDEALARQAAHTAVGRLAEASEIADAIVFLCSQRASYITGVNLLVDGGITHGIA